MNIITRDVDFQPSRAAEAAGDGRTLTGYASVFDQPTEINSWEGRFSETIAPGAFKKTIAERKPILQFNHGRDQRTGQVPIGKFTDIREDEHGLYVEARLFDNPVVEPIRQAIEAEAISGMSFSFQVVRDEWRDRNNIAVKGDEIYRLLYEPGDRGPLQRTIKEVRLHEAGPVVYPAYEGTSVGVRSVEDMTEADREALAAEYRRSMVDEPETRNEKPESRLAEWLEAENTYRWLEAEKAFNTKTSAPEDAVRENTSEVAEHPESNAVPEDTLRRESKSKESEPSKAPHNVRTRVMTLAELRVRQAEIEVRLTALNEEAGDAEMRDADQTEFDALTAERAKVVISVKAIEARLESIKGIATTDTKRIDGAPAVHFKNEDIYDLDATRSNAYSTADFMKKVDDHAKRAIDEATYGVKHREGAQERVTELLAEVDTESRELAKRVLLTGSPEYAGGFSKFIRHGSDAFCTQEERQALLRAQTLSTDAGGGFAVPFQLDPTVILTNAGVVNPIRNLARQIQITGKVWQGVTTGGTSVTRGTESSTAPDASFTLAQPTVTTNRVQGFVPFSIEIDLAWAALMSEITRVLIDAKQVEENSFVTGDGTGTNPGGIVGSLTGQNVTTTTAATFVAADIYKLQNALDPRWEPNATFLAHKAIHHLIRQFDVYGGGLFWGALAEGDRNALVGYPIEKASAMDNTVAAGKKLIAYGDFQNFAIVDRIGMHVELAPMLFDSTTPTAPRPMGQRGVYAVWMNNSKILVPSAFKLLTA